MEGSSQEEGLIEELSAFTALEVKDMCEKRWLNEKSMEFDEEDGTIMEPTANIVEGCYFFLEAVLLDAKKANAKDDE